ncbi:GM17573 [Drosophila sechellia]|uniref:GD15864 n=2 Tax=melanogaster subgroup TaxID=32351 RepID=B4R4L7_DROSI|nr:GM17573 [Drosophila sechellia]EDX17871.1 GD15864 [Drosophila simulans]
MSSQIVQIAPIENRSPQSPLSVYRLLSLRISVDVAKLQAPTPSCQFPTPSFGPKDCDWTNPVPGSSGQIKQRSRRSGLSIIMSTLSMRMSIKMKCR